MGKKWEKVKDMIRPANIHYWPLFFLLLLPNRHPSSPKKNTFFYLFSPFSVRFFNSSVINDEKTENVSARGRRTKRERERGAAATMTGLIMSTKRSRNFFFGRYFFRGERKVPEKMMEFLSDTSRDTKKN